MKVQKKKKNRRKQIYCETLLLQFTYNVLLVYYRNVTVRRRMVWKKRIN